MQISFAALSCSNLVALSCSNLAALCCSNLAALNPGPAGPVSIRIRYACLCGGPRIDPVSPVSSFTL